MIGLHLNAWSAWSPGLTEAADWHAFGLAPRELATSGDEGLVVPERLTRRCTRLTKMTLHVAMHCLTEADASGVRTVFASRHGSIRVAVGLVETILKAQTVSPLDFTHSVHNAPAGVFSLAAQNRQASNSISAGAETFVHGLIEAALLARGDPSRPVLYVIADEPLPPLFRPLIREPGGSYALGLLLTGERDPRFTFEPSDPESVRATEPTSLLPDAIRFLLWQMGDAPDFELGTERRRWTFRRTTPSPSNPPR